MIFLHTRCVCMHQKPTPVLLGNEWEWVIEHGERKLTQVEHFGYTVDIEEGLKVYIAMSI